MAITIVTMDKFVPLSYTVEGDAPYIGSIKIRLPKNHFNIKGLALMDAVMPELNAHLGVDAQWLSCDIEGVVEPGLSEHELHETMLAMLPHFKKLHSEAQKFLDERGPLLGSA